MIFFQYMLTEVKQFSTNKNFYEGFNIDLKNKE